MNQSDFLNYMSNFIDIEEIEAISTIEEALTMLKGMKETLEVLLEEEDTEERARLHSLMWMVEGMEKSL